MSDSANDRTPRVSRGQADVFVMLSILVVLLAAAILAVLTRRNIVLACIPPDSLSPALAGTFAVGAIVGFAELISRFRDNPWGPHAAFRDCSSLSLLCKAKTQSTPGDHGGRRISLAKNDPRLWWGKVAFRTGNLVELVHLQRVL
jgi:hypothetical protein